MNDSNIFLGRVTPNVYGVAMDLEAPVNKMARDFIIVTKITCFAFGARNGGRTIMRV